MGGPGIYTSSKQGIWTDRVTRLDRNPEAWAARDVAKHKRDCFGNRVKPQTKEQAARAKIQRLSAVDKEFAALWRNLTPAEANALVDRYAGLL